MNRLLANVVRGCIALVTVVVAYHVYTITVEPWIDPPLARQSRTLTDDELAAGRQGVSRYQQLLGSYFPAEHWSLHQPPIVIESGQVMLVLSKYQRHDNGSVDLERCAVVLFPTPRRVGEAPPRDAIVLEAPGGAFLQFDDEFDPARGKMGRIVKGDFPGTITIRSEMRDPGRDDDLYIQTSDLSMNESVIKTLADVRLQYGKSEGGGRHLEIGLARDDHVRQGMNLTGVKSLEIRENVHLNLHLGGLSVTGDRDRVAGSAMPNGAAPIRLVSNTTAAPFDAPVRVTCQGSFHFDFLDYEAIFERKVEVRQERLDGPFDALDCNELSLFLAELDANGVPVPPPTEVDDPTRQRRDLKNLRPYRLRAVGSVRFESPVQQLAARAQRMQVNLPLRQLTIDSGPEVILQHAQSELHVLAYGANNGRSPVIVYTHPPAESPSALGDLRVTGPGWLRTQAATSGEPRTTTIKWQQVDGGPHAVVLSRIENQPVLSLVGHPEIESVGSGRLIADRLQLYLREVAADGKDGPALEIEKKPHKLAIMPDRMAAAGKVEINSPQLTGTTRQLQAWFRTQAAPATAQGQTTTVSTSPTIASPLVPRANPAAGQANLPPKHRFDLQAEQVSLDVAINGRQAEPVSVTCQGGVVLRETSGNEPGEKPLRVDGQTLRVEQLATQPTIAVRGTPAVDERQQGLASITARGLTLYAAQVNADAEHGRFWIEGPGKARMMVDGGAIGETPGSMVPVHLNWRGGLSVDGPKIIISGDIFAESEHSWLQCDRVAANLTRPPYPAPPGNEKVELAEVNLLGNIVVDHRGVDERGQTSHDRAQLRSLVYNHLTGAFTGDGPGSIRSAHLSDSTMDFTGKDKSSGSSPARLRYLRVDFQQGIAGNATQRVLLFRQRVRVTYGPIDGWQQELYANDPAGLPTDTYLLACDELQINEDPTSVRFAPPTPGQRRMGSLEGQARGNVQIEGTPSGKGRFTSSSPLASFNQAKDVFELRGTRDAIARVTYVDPKNGKVGKNEAESFTYYRTGQRLVIGPFRQMEVTPGAAGGTMTFPQRQR